MAAILAICVHKAGCRIHLRVDPPSEMAAHGVPIVAGLAGAAGQREHDWDDSTSGGESFHVELLVRRCFPASGRQMGRRL